MSIGSTRSGRTTRQSERGSQDELLFAEVPGHPAPAHFGAWAAGFGRLAVPELLSGGRGFMRFVSLVLLGVLAVGCETAPPKGPEVFGPQSQRGGLANGSFGSDCLQHGASDCASGLCARLDRLVRVCTRTCSSSSNCPAGWRCALSGPTSTKTWCVPENS
jgi:hypothetical protein